MNPRPSDVSDTTEIDFSANIAFRLPYESDAPPTTPPRQQGRRQAIPSSMVRLESFVTRAALMCLQSLDCSMTDAEPPAEGARIRMKVKTMAGDTSHEGVVIPPMSQGHLTLKLDNGYNVSHPLSALISFKELASGKRSATVESIDAEFDEDLPLVRIIHTGGTIASKVDYSTGAVVARFEPGELLSAIPELSDFARIEAVKIGNMWSDDMRPQHWNLISAAISEAFADGATGVVVTQGTDTMHLTSCALSLIWAGEGGRPSGRIAITGSQRSSDRGSSDAAENLMAAVHWAASGPAPDGGMSDAAVIVMHAGSDDGKCSVLPGCAVRKHHSSRRDAFRTVNSRPIAEITLSNGKPEIHLMEWYEPKYEREVTQKPALFDSGIKITQLLAGPHLRGEVIGAIAALDHDAIMIQGTGLGHLPIEDPMGDAPENLELRKAITEWCDSGRIAMVSSQCIGGPVNMAVYSKGRGQMDIGIIGHDSRCGPDAALVKLHWLISRHGRDAEMIGKLWSSDLVGENPSVLME